MRVYVKADTCIREDRCVYRCRRSAGLGLSEFYRTGGIFYRSLFCLTGGSDVGGSSDGLDDASSQQSVGLVEHGGLAGCGGVERGREVEVE